jgi:prepilin-type N-terminal cleavage/methylation domain-containing protein
MKNERGLTLIEMLATITISSIVLAVGFMLFTSVNGLFNNTVQKSADDSSTNQVIDTISRELADPVAIYYYIKSATQSELRFRTFDNRYMALIYDKSSKRLSIAKITSLDITDLNLTFPNPKVLASNIAADSANTGLPFIVNNKAGTALTSNTLFTAANLKTLNLSITFQKATVAPNGGKILTYSTKNTIVSMSYP